MAQPKFNNFLGSSIADKSIGESEEADFEREELEEVIPHIKFVNTLRDKLSTMNDSFMQLKENINHQSEQDTHILK